LLDHINGVLLTLTAGDDCNATEAKHLIRKEKCNECLKPTTSQSAVSFVYGTKQNVYGLKNRTRRTRKKRM